MVKSASYYAISIGLIYILIGLISGFGMIFIAVAGDGYLPDSIVSAHSHFICMSILILIVGLIMKSWAYEIEEKWRKRLGSMKASVILLSLGAITVFIFLFIQVPEPALIGYILFLIGFFMLAINWLNIVKK